MIQTNSLNKRLMMLVMVISTVVRIQAGRILEEAIGRRLKCCNLIGQFMGKVGVIVAMKVVINIKTKRKIIFQSHHHFTPLEN